jgi:hypothetical protein
VGTAIEMRRVRISAAALFVGAAILLGTGKANAASYPAGGSTFTGSAEGWKTTNATCSIPVPLACSASGEYDGAAGDPPGSLAAKGTVVLNAVGLFKADIAFESPSFTAGEGGLGSLNLQRAFTPSGGLEVTAQLAYSATLVDSTNGQQQKAISETTSGASAFTSKSGAVTLVAGHSYVVVIESEINATLAALSTGSAVAGFDNVSMTGPGGGGGGGGGGNGGAGGNGANGLTNSQLESLIKSSLSGPAIVKGNKIYVKAKCPAKVGVACRVTVQGLLKKGKPATAPRTAKIAKGKSKRLVLKVKPKAKSTIAKRRRLLFKETVKAGKAKATVYKQLKLIHR